ncbi:MAG: diaminopimelate epimerase [Alphaproteobacteria bacterium]|nr:diaminopimelate epimerase [Alphaproteobacteria bacterium]
MTPFLKMHGLGNDFVVFDARKSPVALDRAQARALADRRHGIGCDQVIVMERSTNGADASMRIFNADGGEVESCGNAARCVARLLMDENGARAVALDSAGGTLNCASVDGQVRIDMGIPKFSWRDIPLREERDTISFSLRVPGTELPALKQAAAVNVGNPHCVLFVEDAATAPVQSVGPTIETHPLFPQRTNLEFVQVLSPDRMRMRVWERGAGMTLACGTGACASVAAAYRRGLCRNRVDVGLDGGTLRIEWEGEGSPIFMTGPSALSYRGEIDLGAPA